MSPAADDGGGPGDPARASGASAARTLDLPLTTGVATLVLDAPSAGDTDAPRPYLHPMRTPSGRVVTDLHPADHPWHAGLSLAISQVGTTNLWGGPTWVPGDGYRQLDNLGSQVVTATRRHPAGVTLDVEWRDAEGTPLVRETRRLTTVELGDGAWRLDVDSRWRSAVGHDLVFGSPTTAGRPDAGYGGLFLRGASEMLGATVLLGGVAPSGRTTTQEARVATDGRVATDAGARVVTAAAARGTRADWCALVAGDRTVAMRASSGPIGASPWFVRIDETVMLCAAPFFADEWTLAPRTECRWSWSLLVADGALGADEITRYWA